MNVGVHNLSMCLQFGSYNLTYADMINCISPCGTHGMRVPLISQTDRTAVGCTCQCDPGWSTDTAQPFESYVYCAMEDPNSDGSLAPNQNLGGDWRPPVPMYPPPPPKTYEDQSSKKLPLFKWAIIGASIIVFGTSILVIPWKNNPDDEPILILDCSDTRVHHVQDQMLRSDQTPVLLLLLLWLIIRSLSPYICSKTNERISTTDAIRHKSSYLYVYHPISIPTPKYISAKHGNISTSQWPYASKHQQATVSSSVSIIYSRYTYH
jgi:hypothetical protein